MKRFFFTLAAIAAAFTLTTSCEDVTDEQKDGLTKVLLAGEYGVISMTNVDTDEGFDEEDFIYEDGKPRLVWVLNLDGTQYMAYNRVWKKKLTTGTWDVSGTTLITYLLFRQKRQNWSSSVLQKPISMLNFSQSVYGS